MDEQSQKGCHHNEVTLKCVHPFHHKIITVPQMDGTLDTAQTASHQSLLLLKLLIKTLYGSDYVTIAKKATLLDFKFC